MSALKGEISFATAATVLQKGDELISDGLLDISGVSRADSAGLALLLELTRRARHAGKPLRIVGASAQVRGLAGFFGIDSALNLEDAAA